MVRSSTKRSIVQVVALVVVIGLTYEITIRNALPTVATSDEANLSAQEQVALRALRDRTRKLDEQWHESEVSSGSGDAAPHRHEALPAALVQSSVAPPQTASGAGAGKTIVVQPAAAIPRYIQAPAPRPRAKDGSQLTREEEDDQRKWPRRMVVGMPTVKRDGVSYLRDTMRLLVERLTRDLWKEVLIIVYPAEIEDASFAPSIATQLRADLPEAFEAGLITMLMPDPTLYPTLDGVHDNFGDPPLRVKWRSKQNIDYAILMDFATGKGRYYLQLEDDVVPDVGWYDSVVAFIESQRSCYQPKTPQGRHVAAKCAREWAMLQVSVGAIGCIFRDSDVPKVATFYRLMYDEQPVDWLNDRFIQLRGQDKRISRQSSLFKHIGLHSSLKGKIQTVDRIDPSLLKHTHDVPALPAPPAPPAAPLASPHDPSAAHNPPATLTTNVELHKGELDDAYANDAATVWLKKVTTGDHVTILFHEQVHSLKSVYIATGAPFATSDVLEHGLLAVSSDAVSFHDIPTVSSTPGLFTATLDPPVSGIRAVRLRVTAPQEPWLLIRQIAISAT